MYMGLQILIGLIYVNFVEWVIHKNILHGLGKNKKSIWSFHWKNHHKNVRKYKGLDPVYIKGIRNFNAHTKDLVALVLGVSVHIPVLFYFPAFFWTLVFSAILYYILHRKSHNNVVWARYFLTWHYDHHMGKNQDVNWCVTWPLFDWIMGTRVKYAFTNEEYIDLHRMRTLRKLLKKSKRLRK
jgi:hypothetical protein